MKRLVLILLGLAVVVLIASCGGGGKRIIPPPTPPETHDVSGTLADPYGNPIADASILINGEDAGLSTGTNGEFTIPEEMVPGSGMMRLGFRHQGILLGEREIDPTEDDIDLRFGVRDPEGGTVNGLVMDEEDSAPLPDSLVIMFKVIDENAEGWAAFDLTGAEGTFEFTEVPAGNYQLLAYHLGYRLEMVSLAVEGGKTTQQLVYLTPRNPTPPPEGYTVRGYVRDADTQAGIPDAVVTGDSSGGWYYLMDEAVRAEGATYDEESGGDGEMPVTMPPYPPEVEPPVHQTTTTDGEGYFEFPDPFNGVGVYLSASAEDYMYNGGYFEKDSDGVTDAELLLEPIIPVHVAGNVHDPEGNGIEGAYVEFVFVGTDQVYGDGLVMPAGGMAETDANELAEQASAPAPSAGEGGESYDQSPDNLAMQRLRYQNREGRGASQLPGEPFGYYSAVTDENGDFDLGEIPAGFYSVFATAYGYLGYWDMREIAEDDPNAEIELEEVPVGSVGGTVKDENGDPIVDALVNATQPYVDPFTFTDENGGFLLDNVPEGTWQVGAYKEGYDAASITVEIVENVELTLDFTLYERTTPPPTDYYTFTGRVLDGVTGEPVTDAEFVAVAMDNSYWAHDFSGGDGYFELSLPAGGYNIDIEHDGYEALYTSFWVGDMSGPEPLWDEWRENDTTYVMDFYLWPIGSGPPVWGGGNRGWIEDGTDVPPPSTPGEAPGGA